MYKADKKKLKLRIMEYTLHSSLMLYNKAKKFRAITADIQKRNREAKKYYYNINIYRR